MLSDKEIQRILVDLYKETEPFMPGELQQAQAIARAAEKAERERIVKWLETKVIERLSGWIRITIHNEDWRVLREGKEV